MLSWGNSAVIIKSVYLDPGLGDADIFVPLEFLLEEVDKRTSDPLEQSDQVEGEGGQILLVAPSFSDWPAGSQDLRQAYPLPGEKEGYRILSIGRQIYVQGTDFRGLLYGIGYFLRKAVYAGTLQWEGASISTAPDKPVRGHQIGFRNTANSYDAWTPGQYEQYLRDMIVFGTNSIENTPSYGEQSPHFTLSRRRMNVELSRLSKKYRLDYWIWTPIEFDLRNREKAGAYLRRQEELYRALPRLDAVFIPGGDPGDNPPERVLPMMEQMARTLKKHHPEARLWLSLQGFSPQESQFVYDYLARQSPRWMGGLVAGPGSPPMAETRAALPEQYALRHYPDITHTVRCQYPNWWWDPAYNFTLGREPINPQPRRYRNIVRHTEEYTDGFITYSDGMHDDLNKMIWSQLGWDKATDPGDLVKDYANYFLDSHMADRIADALFALEQNWDGAVKYNGSVTGTLRLWQTVSRDRELDNTGNEWRWNMYLLRAYYDALVRKRFIYEEKLEQQANAVMQKSKELGSAAVIDSVKGILNRAESYVEHDPWKDRIYSLADELFREIGYQSSVPLYRAKNPERSAILDFVDRPLNNRWWIESEFERISGWTESRKVERLVQVGSWETPGKGSFYDDVGNVYKSPHVVKLQAPDNDPLFELSDNPGFDWWEEGYSKARLSWMSSMRWPVMQYRGLDPGARYIIRLTGVGEFYTYADGQPLEAVTERKETGEIIELDVPRTLTRDGTLRLTWQNKDERHLNWRQHSRLNEIWLIKEAL
ncbi:hypothetical protein [Fodinibius roseus]|nr:hypothetical protein [Fodinibius roseus]